VLHAWQALDFCVHCESEEVLIILMHTHMHTHTHTQAHTHTHTRTHTPPPARTSHWCPCTQVREVGRLLGVPPRFISRHPFPGPGLAVRVMGDVTEGNKLDCLREADEIFIECIKEYGLYDEIWQVRAPPALP